MKKASISLLVLLLILFAGLSLSQPVYAGLDEGYAAYERGDYEVALREFMLLAEQGDVTAQYNVGMMYYEAKGVTRDYVLAYMWFNLATAQGNDGARQMLDILEKDMAREQIAEAQRFSKEFKPKGEMITNKVGAQSPKDINIEGDFSISLPVNWIEIPSEEMDEYLEEYEEASKGKLSFTKTYGYQPQSNKEWFEHPFIFISVHRVGRASDEELKKIPKIEPIFQSKLDEDKEAIPGFVLSANFEEIVYDPENHILWNNILMNFEGVGPVRYLSAVLLTEEGYILISCYSKESDFSNDIIIFEEFIGNIKMRDALKFKFN